MVVGDLNVCPHITPAGYKKLEEDGFDLALRLQSDGTKWASNAPNAGTANPRTPRLFDNMLFQPRRSSVLRAFLRYTALPLQYNVTHRCLCDTCGCDVPGAHVVHQPCDSNHHPIVVDWLPTSLHSVFPVRAAVLARFFHRPLDHRVAYDMELEDRAQRSGSGTEPTPVIGISYPTARVGSASVPASGTG